MPNHRRDSDEQGGPAPLGAVDDQERWAPQTRPRPVRAADPLASAMARVAGGDREAFAEVYDALAARVAAAEAAGVSRDRIVVDPGIGFAKTLGHNLRLLNGLSLFHGLGCALMLGASRKRMIGALSNEAPVDARLGGSLALALHGAGQGVQLHRVHDVPETVQALKVWRGMRDVALTP